MYRVSPELVARLRAANALPPARTPEGALPARLGELLSEVGDGHALLDVGTDHAQLPRAYARAAARRGTSPVIMGIDRADAPLRAAARAASQEAARALRAAGPLGAAATPRVLLVEADGLDGVDLPSEPITLSIAGVGGAEIARVLRRDLKTPAAQRRIQRLVLQPNRNEHLVREAAHEAGFAALRERLIVSGERVFITLVLEPWRHGLPPYTRAQIAIGRAWLSEQPGVVAAFLSVRQRALERAAAGATRGGAWQLAHQAARDALSFARASADANTKASDDDTDPLV